MAHGLLWPSRIAVQLEFLRNINFKGINERFSFLLDLSLTENNASQLLKTEGLQQLSAKIFFVTFIFAFLKFGFFHECCYE